MPIGSAKIGVLGAGLVPGGTQTFNAPGTFTVPPGVKKVNITGKGGTGNPGNAGNAGNPGNIGFGGAGGRGQDTNPSGPSYSGTAAGLGGIAFKTTNYYPTSNPGNSAHSNTPNSCISALTSNIGPGSLVSGFAGDTGTAGSAGNAGNPGNPGNASTGLCKTFNGGAGGNAGAGGAAGNGGSGGNGGGGGGNTKPMRSKFCPVPFNSGGSGGNGAGNGGGGMGTNCTSPSFGNPHPPAPCNPVSTYKLGGGGGGGAGINNGTSGLGGVVMTSGSLSPYVNNTPRTTLQAPGGTDPANPFNATPVPTPIYPNIITANTTGGFGGSACILYGGATAVAQYVGPLQNTPITCANLSSLYSRRFSGTYNNLGTNNVTINPNVNNLFRAGGGGGAGGSGQLNQTYCTSFAVIGSGAGGGGGGRGNAGNAGGNSTGGAGSAATPSTFNCVPVTPGSPYPISIGGPSGGQIVISWNPQ